MSDNNLENWEQELKNKLSNHQEPTDAKDFGAFIDKLEDNEFFEPKGKRISVKWTLFAVLLISSVAYWMLSGEPQEEKHTKASTVIETETTQKKIEEIETSVDSVRVKDIQEIDVPRTVIPVTPVVVKKEEEKIDDSVFIEQAPVIVIDSVSYLDKSKEEPKIAPLPRKSIIIMSTDTTVVADTTHVKHRKREKSKNK